jgi:predicted PolB exonuclease-like 3'-5' exonuclease
MNILVFDIETIPDVNSARRLLELDGLNDREVAEIMYTKRRQETGGNEFLRHYMHQVVAISVLLRTSAKVSVWSLGKEDSDEKELLQRFFDGIEKYSPILVSWNGRGFDLPVMHYRSLLHGITAPGYWETGDNDPNYRWNNYISRYHERHTDLMDILAGYDYRAIAPLTEISNMLGFPGKMGMSGDKVWDCYIDNKIDLIRNYCETDVLNTYLIFLRYELMRGRKTNEGYQAACKQLQESLERENKDHLNEFLQAWEN